MFLIKPLNKVESRSQEFGTQSWCKTFFLARSRLEIQCAIVNHNITWVFGLRVIDTCLAMDVRVSKGASRYIHTLLDNIRIEAKLRENTRTLSPLVPRRQWPAEPGYTTKGTQSHANNSISNQAQWQNWCILENTAKKRKLKDPIWEPWRLDAT